MNLLPERLHWAIGEEEKRRGKTIKNAELARAAKTSSTSVGFWLDGVNGISAAKARLLGEFLHVDPLWLELGEGSPVGSARSQLPRDAERRQAAREQPSNRSAVTAYDPEDGIPDDVVLVPESRIEFAGGNGRINYELVEDEEPATYRRSWFQKYGINPDRVRRFRVAGDSMEPMLYARDTILVNLDETQVVDGRLYALRYGDQLRVKYLSRRLDGTLVLRSVNPAYKDEEVPAELANEHITVIGRVRDRSGTGGL
jgi:phage repressor protein C with HTH and peptisase S24 domain